MVFPGLARSWRETPESGRRALDALVRVLVLGLLPVAIGTTVLARPLVAFLFPQTFAPAVPLLALGVWRAPLMTLAFLYQTALIALMQSEQLQVIQSQETRVFGIGFFRSFRWTSHFQRLSELVAQLKATRDRLQTKQRGEMAQ